MNRVCFSACLALACAALLQAAAPEGAGANGDVVSVVRADPRTGKLIRKVVVPGGAPAMKTPVFRQTVERVAAEQSVPPELLHSVIQAESNYNPYAVSPKGAMGLMQLIPSTARRFGVSDAFDPAQNILGGARYLKYLLELYRGDSALALAAYNAGEGAVTKYGGVPPFAETRQYVNVVRQTYAAARATAQRSSKPAAPQPEPEKEEPAVKHIVKVVAPDGGVRYISQ